MRIIRTSSYKKALRTAHSFLKAGRQVKLSKKDGDKLWEVRVAAKR